MSVVLPQPVCGVAQLIGCVEENLENQSEQSED